MYQFKPIKVPKVVKGNPTRIRNQIPDKNNSFLGVCIKFISWSDCAS